MTEATTPQRSTSESVNHYWNNPACVENYDAGHAEGIGAERDDEIWREELRRHFGTDPLKILDLACGTGFASILAAQLGHHVTGVDQSENMLTAARTKAQSLGLDIELAQGSVLEPLNLDDVFDMAMCRWAFWTLPEPETAARTALASLKPGGKFVVFDGLWFTEEAGEEVPDDTDNDGNNDRRERWDESYTEKVCADLPLMHGGGPEAVGKVLTAAGFVDVTFGWMDEIADAYHTAMPSKKHQKYYFAAGHAPGN